MSSGTTPSPTPPEPGRRLLYRIGEVARLTGLPTHVLRYWETEFSQIHPRKGAGGHRLYRDEDLALIRTIQRLLHQEGFTIAGVRKQLAQGKEFSPSKTAPPPSPNAGGAVQDARKGLRELLDLMENTDSLRAGNGSDSGRGAVR